MKPDSFTQKVIDEMNRYLWKKTWTFWPRKCRITRKRQRMFSTMYYGYRIITGPGDDLILKRWLSEESYTFEKLRGSI